MRLEQPALFHHQRRQRAEEEAGREWQQRAVVVLAVLAHLNFGSRCGVRSILSQLVRRADTRIVVGEIPCVARDEQHGMYLRARPDHGIR
jgi:hypothetical protein